MLTHVYVTMISLEGNDINSFKVFLFCRPTGLCVYNPTNLDELKDLLGRIIWRHINQPVQV